MATQQDLSLDYLRGEAQGLHKSIQAAMKVAETAARVELFKKVLAAAKHLHTKLNEAIAIHEAERKQHLKQAATSIATIVALQNAAAHKQETDDMLKAAHDAVEHISEAVAAERGHGARTKTFN
ncbi:MAG: hypothetical protein JOZ28_04675 [Candidatus Eremiobacteraeota bacterium]|nr:hypothetical protein [Candidatus Eremiobacteraeota bacterium]